MLYSEKVFDHFSNPRNGGEIEDANGVGEVGNARCGDIMKMYLKIEDGIIKDVKFKTFGCGAAIATSSMATEMVKGKSIEEALKVTNRAVMDALGGGGAAGGFGAGAAAFFASPLRMGIDVVLELTAFDEKAADADLIITGEGRLDSQSLRGKVVIGVARRAKALGIPTAPLVGASETDMAAA